MTSKTRIALFRGINVGGSNILPMQDLRTLLTGLGLTDVTTYIQSGNAVFCAPRGDSKALARRIGAAVSEACGFAPRVIILTPDELDRIITANPFPEGETAPNRLHVLFLADPAVHADLDGMAALRAPDERFVLTDRAFYFHAPSGIGRSKLAGKLEKFLGVPVTGRNWRTVLKLRDMAASLK